MGIFQFRPINKNVNDATDVSDNDIDEIDYNIISYSTVIGDFRFNLNFRDKTAILEKYLSDESYILIPSHVEYKKHLFTVKSIGERAFQESKNIYEIKFSPDSELSTIGYESFYKSSIIMISLPKTVKIIHKNAFSQCYNLNHIDLSKNVNLLYISHQAFGSTSIEELVIPPFAEEIGQYAFYNCKDLKKIDFSLNNNLKIISKGTFSGCGIDSISISSNIECIEENSFSFCYKLKTVNIPIDSRLQRIEADAFEATDINQISIPSNTILCEKWCHNTSELNRIELIERDEKYYEYFGDGWIIGKSDLKQSNFDTLVFVPRNTKSITIPSFITKIYSCSCCYCKIEKIVISNQITNIGSYAFCECNQLHNVEFESNSKLQIISESLFNGSSIDQVIIPSSIKTIKKYAFLSCLKLKKNYFTPDSKLESIESSAFDFSSLTCFSTPSNVKEIGHDCFSECYNLLIIELPVFSKSQFNMEDFLPKNESLIIMIPRNAV